MFAWIMRVLFGRKPVPAAAKRPKRRPYTQGPITHGRRRWSEQEDADLIYAWQNASQDVEVLANLHHRTAAAIQKRLILLGVPNREVYATRPQRGARKVTPKPFMQEAAPMAGHQVSQTTCDTCLRLGKPERF